MAQGRNRVQVAMDQSGIDTDVLLKLQATRAAATYHRLNSAIVQHENAIRSFLLVQSKIARVTGLAPSQLWLINHPDMLQTLTDLLAECKELLEERKYKELTHEFIFYQWLQRVADDADADAAQEQHQKAASGSASTHPTLDRHSDTVDREQPSQEQHSHSQGQRRGDPPSHSFPPRNLPLEIHNTDVFDGHAVKYWPHDKVIQRDVEATQQALREQFVGLLDGAIAGTEAQFAT
eukprot:m.189680 g.189680  ORF g.189680 m.189680 type:complete len:235 (+) comp14798_c0_seq7:1196-1900(+)